MINFNDITTHPPPRHPPKKRGVVPMLQGVRARTHTGSPDKIDERARTKFTCKQTCSGSAELLEPTMCSRRTCVILGVIGVLLGVIITVAVVLTLPLKRTFIRRCELFPGYDCENLWSVFQQAYVGKAPCNVPMEAYDPLIATAPFKPACNRMMFWSKTKDLVQDFTEKRGCFLTLEETVLGFVLDNLTWCGKEGSSETFTSGCPGWGDCENNPVGSFWRRASAAFADVACGDVSAVLNGSIETPFSTTSIFGSIELKRFKSPKVRSLKIVLVSQENTVSNCTNPSFKDLQKELGAGIKYNCTEMTESKFNECSSAPEKPCGPCW